MAFLVEQAGGVATDGRRLILDIKATEFHGRSGIFLGCKRDVQQVMQFYKDADAAAIAIVTAPTVTVE